jgi:hypothetical protein
MQIILISLCYHHELHNALAVRCAPIYLSFWHRFQCERVLSINAHTAIISINLQFIARCISEQYLCEDICFCCICGFNSWFVVRKWLANVVSSLRGKMDEMNLFHCRNAILALEYLCTVMLTMTQPKILKDGMRSNCISRWLTLSLGFALCCIETFFILGIYHGCACWLSFASCRLMQRAVV